MTDKKYSLRYCAVIGLYLCCSVVQVSAQTQNSKVPWSSFNTGTAVSMFANTAVLSTAGEVLVGPAEGENTRTESGFLVVVLQQQSLLVVEEKGALPSAFALGQNYPNPFNPRTTIRYQVPQRTLVELHIYDVLGRQVTTLVSEVQDPGRYAVLWDGRDAAGLQVASGVYFYRFQAVDFTRTRKLILLR